MIKKTIFLIFFIPLSLFGKSLWKNVNLYVKNWKTGDVLSLIFNGKQDLKFEMQQQNQDSLHYPETKTSGEWLGFLPKESIEKNGHKKTQIKTSLKQQDHWIIPVVIIAQTNGQLYIQGNQTRQVFDKNLRIRVQGQIPKNRVSASGKISFQDVANLNYQLLDESSQAVNITNASDLVFETNFLDIQTNTFVLTNILSNTAVISNNITNLTITSNYLTKTSFQTNPSRIELHLKGLSESKHYEMLVKYISAFLKLIK